MNNLDLSTYGVEEMNQEEMKSTDGGFWPAFLIGILVAECLDRNASNDYNEGFRDAYYR